MNEVEAEVNTYPASASVCLSVAGGVPHPERHFDEECPHALHTELGPNRVVYLARPTCDGGRLWIYVEDIDESGQGFFNAKLVCTTNAQYISRCRYYSFGTCIQNEIYRSKAGPLEKYPLFHKTTDAVQELGISNFCNGSLKDSEMGVIGYLLLSQ